MCVCVSVHACECVCVCERPTCALLAGEGEVVVTGHVVPLAVLVPDHHHTVLPQLEEGVRLVRPPVLVLLQIKII